MKELCHQDMQAADRNVVEYYQTSAPRHVDVAPPKDPSPNRLMESKPLQDYYKDFKTRLELL